jgi:hypothetical protein
VRAIDRARYGAEARRLVDEAFAAGLPRTLPFGDQAAGARAALERLDAAAILGGRAVRDARAAAGLRAGLWLLHDFMDEAHAAVQDIETPGAAYFHAILHRREPDAHNSDYWYARVGEHAIFVELARDAGELLAGRRALAEIVAGGRFHARRFVEHATASPEGADRDALLALQRREWELLFDHEWALAAGA